MLKRILYVSALLAVSFVTTFAQTGTAKPSTSPTPTMDKSAKAPVFRSTKDQVKDAQTMLNTSKVFSGEATGVSSDEWKTAVKIYQGDNGLAKTGALNRATLEKMGIALTDKQKGIPVNPAHLASSSSGTKSTKTTEKSTTPKPEPKATDGPKRPAPFSANKEQIASLQKVLKEGKMFAGEANGERSDELKDSIKKYQEANALKVTGGINAATLEKAGIALTDKQKEQVAAQTAFDAAKVKSN